MQSGGCKLFAIQCVVFDTPAESVSFKSGNIRRIFIGETFCLVVLIFQFNMAIIECAFLIVQDRLAKLCSDVFFILNKKRGFHILKKGGETPEIIPTIQHAVS